MSDTVYPFDTREQFTKIHNYVIDHMMPTLKPNAFKLLILIIRKTKGWGKDADRISYSQMREGMGIASDTTLSAAIKELEELNYIQRERVDGVTTNYTLNTTLKVDHYKNCRGTSTKTVVVTSTETVDTKERVKERKESIEADACEASPSPTRTENLLFPLQEKDLLTNKGTTKTPNPPLRPPPSPSRNPAAAALSAKNRELLKEFEPKARPIWAAIEKQINALAAGDNPMKPEEYEHVFRALKRDPWWANKPLTPSIVGKQAGAILPHVENQVTIVLDYEW